MTPTATARGRANRRKGADAERAVARYLRTQGFPHAERAVRTSYTTPDGRTTLDPLDIVGIPGVVISVKNDASQQITKWWDEAERIGNHHGATLSLLIVRQRGKADVSRWWVWVNLRTLARALHSPDVSSLPALSGRARMELGEFVPMLHRAVYGDAHGNSEPNGGIA